jgi:hypothetical protein
MPVPPSTSGYKVGRAGLKPGTNGLAEATSCPNQIFTGYSCATTGFTTNQRRREPDHFHRFPFIDGEYSVTHLATMTPPSPSCGDAFQGARTLTI